MPRTPDPELKGRILDAADRLLRKHGEQGLTLRAVAKAAGTTTPTVYKRFRNRVALMQALGNRERILFFERLDRNSSLEDVCGWYLKYAVTHRHEYQLVYGKYWAQIFSSEPGEPGMEWAKGKFAERFGGRAADYDDAARWLRMLLHGAASMLVNAPTGPAAAQLKQQCLSGCSALIANAGKSKQ